MTTMAVALAMGLHATHMLVPPTPGPLAVAGILGSNLGLVILLGMLVSIPVTLVSVIAGRHLGKKYYFLPKLEEENNEENNNQIKKVPSPLMSFLPIILPIILMLLRTISTFESKPLGNGIVFNIIDALGQTIVALFIGLIIAFLHINLFIQAIKKFGLLMVYLEKH